MLTNQLYCILKERKQLLSLTQEALAEAAAAVGATTADARDILVPGDASSQESLATNTTITSSSESVRVVSGRNLDDDSVTGSQTLFKFDVKRRISNKKKNTKLKNETDDQPAEQLSSNGGKQDDDKDEPPGAEDKECIKELNVKDSKQSPVVTINGTPSNATTATIPGLDGVFEVGAVDVDDQHQQQQQQQLNDEEEKEEEDHDDDDQLDSSSPFDDDDEGGGGADSDDVVEEAEEELEKDSKLNLLQRLVSFFPISISIQMQMQMQSNS